MKRWESYILWLGRIVLAVLFLLAAWGKISDPQAFARALWNYRMIPDSVIPVLAIGMPIFEALAAIAILLPPLQKGGSLVLLGLLGVFIVALGSALARGLDVDCGCFGEGSSTVSPWLIVRNIALGAVALWSFLRS
jgi:uncharacterized membrane protein YphA (DoxX/SURF4 family)